MTGWTWQAGVGVVGGLLVFALIFAPALVVQYRRYGTVNATRLLGLAAVSVYGVALVAYVFLPLPDPDTVCRHGDIPFQREPFLFVREILDLAQQRGLQRALLSWTTLQVVFNVVLFVPLGVIVRRYLGLGVLTATLVGFGVSAAIEFTQWSAIWGLYPCSYRVGDVDDLIANTSGAFLGAVIAPALLFWMPQSRQLSRHRREPRPVTIWRRWLGMLLDWAGFGIISWTLIAVVIGATSLAAREAQAPPVWTQVAAQVIAGLVIFLLPALRAGGASFGQTVVWLAPSWPQATLGRRLARASITGGVYTIAQIAAVLGGDDGGPWSWVDLAGSLWVGVCLVAVPFTGRARGISARLTGAEMVDVRAVDSQDGPVTRT